MRLAHLARTLLVAILATQGLPLAPLGMDIAMASVLGSTRRISVDPSTDPPMQADSNSTDAQISLDGKYVVFTSAAENLVPNDTNLRADVFVYDREIRELERVSVTSAGAQANGSSTQPEISADGRFVAFASVATNLGLDANTGADIFLHDRLLHTTALVSKSSDGGVANGSAHDPSISADGNRVAYESEATNISSLDGERGWDVYVFDVAADAVTYISHRNQLPQPLKGGENPAISPDGTHVAFTSSTKYSIDAGSWPQVYIADVLTMTIRWISQSTSGSPGWQGFSHEPSISADNRYVVFTSRANGLVAGDLDGYTDVFLRDRTEGTTVRLSEPVASGIRGDSGSPRITPDGRHVVFYSTARDLTSPPAAGWSQIFIRDLSEEVTTPVSVPDGGGNPNKDSYRPSVTADGRLVSFESVATNLVSGDTNNRTDIFVRDRFYPEVWVPDEQTLGSCGGAGLAGRTTVCRSDPVDTATGNFSTSSTDILLPGIGLPFAFRRTYNSADNTAGALGVGWTHPFEMSLTARWDGDVVVRSGDGQRLRFAKAKAPGVFRPPPGGRAELVRTITSDYELRRRDGTAFGFDPDGRLEYLRDRNDNEISLGYSAGLPSTVTDTAGREIDLAYNGSGLLTSLTLPDGRDVVFTYSSGRLATATDLAGKTTTYTYNGADRLVGIEDPSGNDVITNVYTAGRVVEQTDQMGGTNTFAWDPETETATMTDPLGKVWTDVYSKNKLLERKDPLGNTTTYTYDADLNVISMTDPLGRTWGMSYDAKGNLLTRTAPASLGWDQEFTYTSKDLVETATDAKGNTTTFHYDAVGNLDEVIAPGMITTEFDRNTLGQLVALTDPRGKVSSFAYDADGNLRQVAVPLGGTTTMSYDVSGRMTSMVEPRGNAPGGVAADYTWTFAYDDADRLVSATDPLGNESTSTYDDAGNLASRADANGHTISYAYNAASELTSVTAPDSTVTAYDYDAGGRLIERTDAKNHVTSYAYDGAGRLVETTDPLGRVWTYGYDDVGNLTDVVTATGNATATTGDGSIAYGYDDANRLTSIDYSDATPDVSLGYDANGNLTSMSDGAGTQSRTYDALDRLTGVARGTDAFAYAYDAGGNLTQRTYPDGTVVAMTYDDDSRLASLLAGGELTTYGYDAAGKHTVTQSPNATTETRTYDKAGRLTKIASTGVTGVISSVESTLDPVGNPTQVVSPEGTTTYGYDLLDRLTSVCFAAPCASPDISWTYDAVGNRSSETRAAGATSYACDAADQMTSAGGTSFSYDANGNQSSAGPRSFTYDLANRLVSSTSGGSTVAYAYDGLGKRLARSLGGDHLSYVWDEVHGLPELALERDSVGVARRYVHGMDLERIGTRTGSFQYHHDGLGSVLAMTSALGATVASYRYEPFGTERAPTLSAPPGSPQAENRMRFTGELADPSTGLYHLRAREYDPGVGRFPTRDPLPSKAGSPSVSAYAYVSNMPTTMIDPSGMRGCEVQRLDDGSFLDFRSAHEYWDAKAEEAAGDPSGFVAFLKFVGPASMGSALNISGLENVQNAAEVWATPCTSGGQRAVATVGAAMTGLSWLGGGSAAFPELGRGGHLFGRGGNWGAKGIFNRGPVRIGWGWNNKKELHVFRLAIGPRHGKHPHLDFPGFDHP